MTTNTNVGNQTPDGAGENTNSPVSPENGQPIAGTPQGSQELLELRKGYERLEKELRGLQSRQDVEKNDVQRFMAEVKQQMAKGKSLEEAEAAVTESRKAQEKDDLLFKIAQKVGVLGDVSQTAAGNGGNVTDEAAQVISELKLDANAPEVLSILQKGLDPLRQELELRRLATRPRPQPTPAESPSVRSTPASPDKAAEIERGYLAAIAKVPRGNTHMVSQVKAEWRKKAREAGLNLNV